MNFEDAIVLAKSRSDCEPKNIDTLVRVAKETAHLHGSIAECGSYRCGSTIALAVASPSKKIFAFDLFGGLPYGEGHGFEHLADADIKEIYQATAPFENIILISGKHEDTVPDFASNKWSMIFMDSDHYSSHEVCLRTFWPNLSSGGYVVFHDAGFEGVQKAIQEIIPDTTIETFSDSLNMGYIVKP